MTGRGHGKSKSVLSNEDDDIYTDITLLMRYTTFKFPFIQKMLSMKWKYFCSAFNGNVCVSLCNIIKTNILHTNVTLTDKRVSHFKNLHIRFELALALITFWVSFKAVTIKVGNICEKINVASPSCYVPTPTQFHQIAPTPPKQN